MLIINLSVQELLLVLDVFGVGSVRKCPFQSATTSLLLKMAKDPEHTPAKH